MNVPNLLTVIRILLVPLILLLLTRREFGVALWLVLGAGLTDFLDGYIARRFGLMTRLGGVLDPLADKLLVDSSFMALAALRLVPWWLAIAIVGRDLVILTGAGAWYRRMGSIEMEPTLLSKANTCAQVVLLYLVIADTAGIVRLSPTLPFLFIVSFVLTFVSGLHYVVVWGGRVRVL
ncbi:MAG TPA: CDP-diacylglycerol--glycerol-3-phosphate 3-phosphatidyltransferase [Geobacteraceae bacterium]